MIGNSDDETNFPHKLLATNKQVANLRRAFTNHPKPILNFQKLSCLR